MIRRLLIVGAVVLATLAIAPAAHAGENGYGPSVQGITLTNADGSSGAACTAGGGVSIVSGGFQPGSTVTFTFNSDPVVLGSATADEAGNATLNSNWPADAADGPHTVTASGTSAEGGSLEYSASTECGAAGAGAGGTLPRTGSDSAPLFQIAIALVAAGGLLVLAARKRMQSVKVEA